MTTSEPRIWLGFTNDARILAAFLYGRKSGLERAAVEGLEGRVITHTKPLWQDCEALGY